MVSPILLIVVPLGLAFVLPLFRFISTKIGRYIPAIAMLFNLIVSLDCLPRALRAPIVVRTGQWAPPFSIHLVAGPLGLGMAALIALVGFLVSVYGIVYIRESARDRYDVLYILLLTGATGIVLTGDIFNLYVFFEILCVSSYALVAFRGDRPGVEAAAKYLIQGAVGSALALVGIGMLYGLFGTLSMADIAQNITSCEPTTVFVALALLITGFGVEGALFPLNGWLPDAHSSAPSTISAILSGIAIQVGVFAVAKIVLLVFGAKTILFLLVVLGLITLLVGEMSAFAQENIKRMLAYSSIGQVGLILFAVSIASPGAVSGGLFLIVSHALAKALLFICAGYMIYRTGSTSILSMNGIAKRMPLTSLCFSVGALSLVGLPPFVGFPSKFMIIRAALQQPQSIFTVLMGIALLGTVVEGAYFLRVIQGIYFRPAANPQNSQATARNEAPWPALVPIVILAAIIVIVGLYPQLVGKLVTVASSELLDRSSFIRAVMGG